MAKRWPKPKDPQDVLDYEIKWDKFLDDTDTISGSVFTIVSGTCVIDSDSFTDTTTTVWLSGGEDGETCEVLNHITTASGREKDQTGILKIKAN